MEDPLIFNAFRRQARDFLIGFLAIGLSVWIFPQESQASPSATTQSWYLLKLRQQPVGYVHIQQRQNTTHQWVTDVRSLNRIKRQGQPFDHGWTTQFIEDGATGAALSFHHRLLLPNALPQQTDARLKELWPTEHEKFLFPVGRGISQLYQEHFEDPVGSTFDFKTLNLADQPELVSTHVAVGRPEMLHIPGLGRQMARRFKLGKDVTEWRNAQGNLLKAICESMGTEMIYASERSVSHLTAVDAIVDTQIPSTPIQYPRVLTEGLFKISASRMANPEILNEFNHDAIYQLLEKNTLPEGGKDIFIRTKTPKPRFTNREYPISGFADYLADSPLINRDDSSIALQAKTLAGQETRAYITAQILRRWVAQNIRTKSLESGFASASETMLSREGDCTEHAVLFAALTRALGIPNRIAVGLVYLPQPRQALGSFVFHMWNEVNIGPDDQGQAQWVPMDASFKEDQPDATHLKIEETALNSSEDIQRLSQKVSKLAGYLNIEVVSAQSPPEGVFDLNTSAQVAPLELPQFDLASIDLQKLSQANIVHASITPPPSALSLDEPEGQYVLGLERLSQDDYVAAIAAFEKALAMTKGNEAFYRLGQQFLTAELYGFAAKAFDHAGQNPGRFLPSTRLTPDQEALFFSGVNLQRQGNGEAADEVFRTLRANVPEFAPTYIHLGELALTQEQFPEAESLFRVGLRQMPQNQRAAIGLAQALKQQDHFAEAAQVYQQAGMLEDQKIAASQAVLFKQPNAVSALVSLADGAYANHQAEVAKAAYLKAWKQGRAAEALRGLFQIALDQADWLSLRQLYPLTSQVRQSPELMSLRAQYNMRLRHYSAAAQIARQAITSYPKAISPYLILAQIQQRQGQSPQAMLEAGITRTQATQLKLTLAKALVKLNPTRALQLTTELLRSTPRLSQADPQLLATHVRALTNSGNFQQAGQILKEVLDYQPDVPDLLMAKGELAVAEDFSGQAVLCFQKVLSLVPGDAAATTALRDVITEHQLGLKKPEELWILSDDEMDYLIQREIFLQEAFARDGVTYQNYQQARRSTSSKNLAGIEAYQTMLTELDKTFEIKRGVYEQLKRIQPPARFMAMHEMDLNLLYARLQAFHDEMDPGEKRDYFLTGQSKSSPASPKTGTSKAAKAPSAVDAMLKASQLAQARYQSYISKPDQDRIKIEAKLSHIE